MSDLREPVARAMAVIGCGWRETSPGVFAASIPPELRHHFRGQAALRVVFDPDVWQQDRRAELAQPGGGFLDGLERALAERAGQPIRVSGVLASDGALGREWASRVRVVNAEVEKFEHPIAFERAIRFVFEVELPVSPPVTELVTVACDLQGNLLTPKDLAQRDPPEAYDYDECAGAVPTRIEWPAAQVASLRPRCRAEVERRVRRTFANELLARTARSFAQLEEVQRAFDRERDAALTSAERAELEEEFKRRRAVHEASAAGTIRVQERTATLLVTGKDSLVARYRRRDGASVEIVPKMSLGRLRDDQCAHCQNVRHEYVLAQQKAELWCTSCGRACTAPGCTGTMRAGAVTCSMCTVVRWCTEHVLPCATCFAPNCPEHGHACTACGVGICKDHARHHSTTGEPLCEGHGVPCAVDGAVFRFDELIRCAASGEAVCPTHRVAVDVPQGAIIRVDRVRVCAASGQTMDVGLTGLCTVDRRTYAKSLLVECPVTHLTLHPSNAVAADGDPRILHPLAVTHSTLSGMVVAKDRVVGDEFVAGEVLHPSEATRCELSGRWTATARTQRVACCGRVVAQPLVVAHAATSALLCQDHAAPCGEDGAFFHANELRACGATGMRVCPDHGVTLDDPPGGWVRRERVRVCTETLHRIDQDAAGTCTVDGAQYKRTLLVVCPLTHREFHPKHGIRPEGDARLLHPAAVVYSHISGNPVARDLAIRDAFVDAAFLHPTEVAQCALSLKWTATARTVLAPCCERRIAISLTAESARSGKRVCNECARGCEAGHGPFLPEEGCRCDRAGAWWCLEHIVRTACGRHVGPDQAIQLDDGAWECLDHYRYCVPGLHPTPAGSLTISILTGRECCPDHRTTCGCHGGIVGGGEYALDPYDGSAWCPSALTDCPQCGERAPAAPDTKTCRWCATPTPLDHADPHFAVTYRSRIAPGLRWYTVRLRVHVTGTPSLAWFRVSTLTGGLLVFRVTSEKVEAVPSKGVPRAR